MAALPETVVEPLHRWITPAEVARIHAPLAQAGGLPNAAYTDPDYHRFETERLFARRWTLAGFAHQLPQPGDALPVTVAGRPLILARGGDGTLRAFHNVCPHRGTQLLDSPSSGRPMITCPYHAWSFDLTGRLRARPHFHGPNAHDRPEEPTPDTCLAAVRCESWFDWLFVDLSGEAGPLADWLAPAARRLRGHDLTSLRHAGSFSLELEANWKLCVENYIEPYHVFAVHPRLLAFAPMEVRTPSTAEGDLFYNEYLFPRAEAGRGEGLPHFPDLSAQDARRGFWLHLFPSLSFEVYPDQLTVFRTVPLAAERTREEFHVYLVGEAADGEAFADARAAVFDTWRSLNDEDVGLVERLQRGRLSPGYHGGRLSPFWDEATLHFARLVVEALSATRG